MRDPKPGEADDGDATGLPGLSGWGSVYALVSAIVFIWLLLLAVLTRFYS